uniref:Uncharacterized protein n=1 Tax=Anguilla anguilla TaxID=7936 RepID=A0A0E9WM54_ANGAN
MKSNISLSQNVLGQITAISAQNDLPKWLKIVCNRMIQKGTS